MNLVTPLSPIKKRTENQNYRGGYLLKIRYLLNLHPTYKEPLNLSRTGSNLHLRTNGCGRV